MRDSFIFYKSFYDSIKELDPQDQVQIYNAIFKYQFDSEEIDLKGVCKSIFTLIIPQLKANNNRYENGKKGGAPKGNQNATKKQPKNNQKTTKKQPNENENENENVNVNVNDKINEFILYNNFSENLQCECITKSTNVRCNRKSSFNINGKNYCNQHARELIPDIVKKKSFVKPTIEEIQEYCLERHNGINAEAFYDFYESKNWFVGKNKMVDWKACVRTWEKRTTKNQEPIPDWFDKKIETKKASIEEQQKMEELLKEYR